MSVAILAALLLGQINGSGDLRRDFAAGTTEAVLMLPPDPVCAGTATQMVWSGDGAGLIVLRIDSEATPKDLAAVLSGAKPTPEMQARAKPKSELVYWSLATRKTRTLLTLDPQAHRLDDLRLLPGSDRILLHSIDRTVGPNGEVVEAGSVTLLSTGGGGTVTLMTADDDLSIDYDVSPKRPVGYFQTRTPVNDVRVIRFFGTNGRLSNPLSLPPRAFVSFGKDGNPVVVADAKDADGKRILQVRTVNPATFALGPLFTVGKGYFEEEGKTSDLQFEEIAGKIDGASAPSILLAVPGGKPEERGVVTTDGNGPLLSPKENAVAYGHGGAVMVRRLVRLPRKAFDDARLAALKAVAINNAKQAATALIIYANDNDDSYPSPGDYTKIYPYLKDASIMNSFSYTFGGGRQTMIEKPAETELGYVVGPGGRAVAYADGDVKWIPDAP